MLRIRWLILLSLALTLATILAACGPTPATGPTAAPTVSAKREKDRVTLQLKWVTQSQFAGYYAAKEKGFYDAENLDVKINPGGPDIIPEQVVASGSAQFGLDWLPSLLSAREQGTPLLNIAQVFQYSGMREIYWADSGIKGVADLRGKKVAVWFGGNEFELLATLEKYGINKDKDVTLLQQPFDMNLLLQKQVDAAAAMTYNEYAQVLEAGHKAQELGVIDFNKEGTAMLEDGIFVNEGWLKDPKNQDIAVRFLRASLKGWIFCRDNAAQCVDIVLKQGPTLPKGHQSWMMNEINKLIWPSPKGIGLMDEAAFNRTADIALKYGVIKKPASTSAYTTKIWEDAIKGLQGSDDKGLDWKPLDVQVTPGGR